MADNYAVDKVCDEVLKKAATPAVKTVNQAYYTKAAILCALLLVAAGRPRGQAIDAAVGTGAPVNASTNPAAPADAVKAAKVEDDAPADRAFSPVTWRWGDWRGFISITAQLRYDDNVLQNGWHPISDFIGVAIPGFNVEYIPAGKEGDALLHLDYSPQFLGYLDHSEFNAVNQMAHLNAERRLGRTEFRLSHSLLMTTEPVVEQTTYGTLHSEITELSFDYQLNEVKDTTLTLAPHQDWSSFEHGITVWEYGAKLEAGYRPTGKLKLLASYDAAEVTSDPGLDAFKQSVLAGLAWEMTGRCQLDLRAGFQTYSFQGGNAAGDSITPEFSLSWQYQFAPKTALRLTSSYDNSVSRYTAYQLNETFQGQVVLSYSLTEKIGLELSGAGGSIDQHATSRAYTDGGAFPFWNTGLRASYNYSMMTRVGISVNHQERGSNEQYSSFDRNIIQFEISHRF